MLCLMNNTKIPLAIKGQVASSFNISSNSDRLLWQLWPFKSGKWGRLLYYTVPIKPIRIKNVKCQNTAPVRPPTFIKIRSVVSEIG